MVLFNGKLFQRVGLLSIAFILAISSVSAATPFLFAQIAGAVGSSGVVYDGIPTVQPGSYASLGYQATSTKEFGDELQLSGTSRHLNTVTVSLTDWACGNDYNKVSPSDPCTTTPGSTFNHPITLNIYNVSGGVIGSRITTKTQDVAVPYRPSADPTNCVGADAGKWFDGTKCNNGFSFDVTFDFSAQAVILPSDLVATVAYNTQSYGVAPIGNPGPYNSLNVSLAQTAPTTGTDVNSDDMFWDTTYPGYTGGLKLDTGWTPYHLAVRINTTQIAAPANLRLQNVNGAFACGGFTNINSITPTWDAVPGAVSYNYKVTLPNGSTYGPVSVGNVTSVTGPFGAEGTSSFSVQTVDAYGGVSGWAPTCAVTYDATAPSAPINGQPVHVNSNDFYFTWDAVSAVGGSSIVEYQFQSSGSNLPDSSGSLIGAWKNWTDYVTPEQQTLITPTIHSVGAPDGTYYWQARAVDAAGNVGPWSTVWTLNIDTRASAAPTNARWLNSTTANVLGAYTNQNPTTPAWTAPTTGTVNHYEYSFRSPTSSWSAWESVGNVTNLGPNSFYGAGNTGTEGDWQYRVRTINNFGVASPEAYSATIVYDRTNPNSTNDLSALVSGSLVVQQTITDNTAPASGKMRIWKQNTDGSLNNSQFFSIGDVNVNSSNQVVYSLNTLTNLFGDGVYTAKFTSTDKAGNSSVSQVVFRVDNTAPLLVANGYTGTSLTPTISGTTDGASDVVTIDGASAIVSKTVNNGGTYDWTYTLPTQTIGTHTITVKSTDSNGNSTTATKTVDIQSIPAAPVALTAPATTSTNTTTPAGVTAVNTQPAADNLGTPEVLGTQTKADATDTAAIPEVKGASTQADQASGWALAWYWWVLIIAAVTSFIWWLIARRRNLSEA